MRLAYLKYGDVVAELQLLRQTASSEKSGPYQYVNQMLQFMGNHKGLFVSYNAKNETAHYDQITTCNINVAPNNSSILIKATSRIICFFKTLLLLFKFKPGRIVCAAHRQVLWASFIFSKLYKIPLVHSRHGAVFKAKTGKNPFETLDNIIIRQSKAVLCHGPFLKDQLIAIGVPEHKIIMFTAQYQSLAVNTPCQLSSETMRLISEPFVLFIGRLVKEKGIYDLLDASLQEKLPRILFAGDGPDFYKLKKKIEQLHLAEKALLLGYVPHDQLRGIIKKTLCVVSPTHPSLSEGFNKTVVESFIFGKPVIAPQFGVFLYQITHNKNGLLFKPNSSADLAKKIRKIVSDTGLQKKLSVNAFYTGQSYLYPETSFYQAVSNALKS